MGLSRGFLSVISNFRGKAEFPNYYMYALHAEVELSRGNQM